MVPLVTVGVVIDGEPAQLPPPVIVGLVIAGAVSVFAVKVWVSLTPTIALPGAVSPLWNCEFRFVTTVVLAMENGAVPVDTVEANCALSVQAPLIEQARLAAQKVFT